MGLATVPRAGWGGRGQARGVVIRELGLRSLVILLHFSMGGREQGCWKGCNSMQISSCGSF